VDLGPEGGVRGGEIVAEGTPLEIAQDAASVTGPWLFRAPDGSRRLPDAVQRTLKPRRSKKAAAKKSSAKKGATRKAAAKKPSRKKAASKKASRGGAR
ncbi:MAG: hypothetical protein AAGG01_04935, partial [Planctomycetota bacterium]